MALFVKNAGKRAELPDVRRHDLKHTFGLRLRAAGVGFEDRENLSGHRSDRITTHYSAPGLANLIAAANKVRPDERHKTDTVAILRKKSAKLIVANSV